MTVLDAPISVSAGFLPPPQCPYRGLEPFAENDQAYFFGREEEITTIAANLLTSPMTLLYGASGVGKSSVIMAGVIPFARLQRNTTVVLVRSWQDRGLLPLLNETIASAVKERNGTTIETNCGFDICLASAAAATQTRLTLIFDQFEEFLLYHPSHTDSGKIFDRQFARIVNRAEAPVNVLISIREDWLAKLDRFQPHIPDLLGNLVRLQHLDAAGARKAITEPLRRFNADMAERNEFALPYAIEPELTNVILQQVSTGAIVRAGEGVGRPDGSAGVEATAIETPFLQMILTAIWEAERLENSHHLRLYTLDQLGGASTIVMNYVDDIVDHLSPAHQEICASLFDRLVTPSGSKVAHSADDLAKMIRQDADTVRDVLSVLTKHRLLREAGTLSIVRYEIFHDVLARPILRWRTAYLVAREARERARDRARQRRKRSAVFVLLLTFVCVGAGSYWLRLLEKESRANLHDAAELEVTRARTLARAGRPADAAQCLIAAVKRFKSLREDAGITAVARAGEELQLAGLQYLRSDRCDVGTPFLEAAELVARWSNDRRLQSEALIQWATCELQLDHDRRARDLTDRLQDIARESRFSASKWQSIGLLEMTLQNQTEAFRAFGRAIKIADRAKDDRASAEVYMAIGNVHFDRSDYSSAQRAYEHAILYAHSSNAYEIEVKSVAQLIRVAERLNAVAAKRAREMEMQLLLRQQTDRIRKVLQANAANAVRFE